MNAQAVPTLYDMEKVASVAADASLRAANQKRWVAAAWVLLAVIAASGCSRGESAWQRVTVTGTVTYKGHAVADGSISLRPVSDTRGPAAGAPIRDGNFEISEEQGPTTGIYQAKLLVVVGDNAASAKGKTRSALRQNPNVRQFERSVKFTAGSNTLRFDLK